MKYCICCHSIVSENYVNECNKKEYAGCKLSDIEDRELLEKYKKDTPENSDKINIGLLRDYFLDK